MQHLLVTPGEIIALAFSPNDRIDPELLTDSQIEAVQLKFIQSALPAIYQELTEGLHADFCRKYIKPALAYFVKYYLFRQLSIRISDGIVRLHPTDSTLPDQTELARLRQACRETACLFLRQAILYLEEHPEEFPSFQSETCSAGCPRIRGGMIL